MIGLSWLNGLSLIPSAASDVRLRAKAGHQRIRNRVRGIGRRGHRCVLIPHRQRA